MSCLSDLRSIVLTMLLFLFVNSCKEKSDLIEFSASRLGRLDYSIPLSRDSLLLDKVSNHVFYSIPDLNAELYRQNSQFVVSFGNLMVAEIDTLGNLLKEIIRFGEGLGEINAARSLKAWKAEDSHYYVLTNSNAFSLYSYDKEGDYKYVIRLFSELEGYYHPRNGQYHMTKKEDGQFLLTVAIGSTKYGPFSEGYYRNSYALAQFLIDDITGKVLSVKKLLPYAEVDEVKEALEDRRVSWGIKEPVFAYSKGKYFVAFPFSNKVEVYDQSFNKVFSAYKVEYMTTSRKGYSYSMQPTPQDLYDRTYMDFRAYYENPHVRGIQVVGDQIVLQIQPPYPKNKYEGIIPDKEEIKTKGNWEAFSVSVEQYWLQFNMVDYSERVIKLGAGHHIGKFLDPNTMIVLKSPEKYDNLYIMKYRF